MSQIISENCENFVNMLTSVELHPGCGELEILPHILTCSHCEHGQGILEPLCEQIASVFTFIR